uniref:Zinc transporter ZIP13 n=1 Tax=Capra hircus TaxID=9925 RepID=A0A8C2XZK2_CAPHI
MERACRWLKGTQPAPHPVIKESLALGGQADTKSGTGSQGKKKCVVFGSGVWRSRAPLLCAPLTGVLGGPGGGRQEGGHRGHRERREGPGESESWGALLSGERLETWICSLLGSLMVGLSGVFPLLVIPLEMGTTLRSEAGARRLKQLLSFALGGLLGNVFLHLLPEAWAYTNSASSGGEGRSLQQQQQLGLWVIAGFLTFLVLEKLFLDRKGKEENSQVSPKLQSLHRSVSGYLNLLANTIDNFTHGLAVAASFLVSKKIGLLTTMAILLHEIPHERRRWPGSCPSPPAAFSTSPW